MSAIALGNGTMRRLLQILALGLLSLAVIPPVRGAPDAPQGFHWQRLEAIRASVLSPEGWHFHPEDSDGKLAYFITRDRFDGTGEFKTGLSLNCVREISKKAKLRPSEYIDAFTSEVNAKYSIIDPKTNTSGSTKSIWFGLISPKEGPDASRMNYFLIANNTTDTVYVIVFEAPLAQWTKSYESGYVMLENILIDPSF